MRRLRGVLWVVLLVVGLGVVPAPTAYACSCVGGSLAEHAARSDAVFVGTPVERGEITTAGGGKAVGNVVEVSSVVKGRVHERTLVLTEGEGNSCRIELPTGERVLVLASGEGGRLRTSLCDGTRKPTPGVMAKVEAALGPGAKPIAGDDPALARFEDDVNRAQRTRLLWAGAGGLLLGAGIGFLLVRRRRSPFGVAVRP
jgi:hypothetical protein